MVLQPGEEDGVDHSDVTVQADAGQKEWREVFYAVEEAQDVPGAAGGEENDAGQLQRRDETEQHVKNCQVNNENIRGGGVSLVLVDEPQHCDVGRDAQEHVGELQAEIPDKNSWHVFAALIDGYITTEICRSLRDVKPRDVEVKTLHVGWLDQAEGQSSVKQQISTRLN